MQIAEEEPFIPEEYLEESTPNFFLLKESMEFQIYFSFFFIGFGIFLSYMILLTRSLKIMKLERKKNDNDLRLKKKLSIIMLILVFLRIIRLFYYSSLFHQSDLFLYFFLEFNKFINITLIPFILKEQVKKNIRIPFKKTFIFFWIIIFLNSFFDVFLEFYYSLFFKIITLSLANFLCSSILLFLFIKNPVKNFNLTNDYNCYLIELENKLPEAVRKIYDYDTKFHLKSKTASPKKRKKISDFKSNKDHSLLIKGVSDFKIIKNEEFKITPNLIINDLKENLYLDSFNNSENVIFNTLNDSFENPTHINNSKNTFNPKIEINFKDNYIFSCNHPENKINSTSNDFEFKHHSSNNCVNNIVFNNYNNKGCLNNCYGIYQGKNYSHSFLNIYNREEILNSSNINKISLFNNIYSNTKNQGINLVSNINQESYLNIGNYQYLDETKKAILDIAAKFFFVFTVRIRELQIIKNIKKNIKDFFDLENSLRNEFLYSNNIYVKKIQEKLPRLKFPKKLKHKNKDFFRNYSVNFHIFLKSIVTESCFITDDVLRFFNLHNNDILKNHFQNVRLKYINNFRFNDDTINNQRYQSFISASFIEEKINNENEEEENINNINSNFSTTSVDNYNFIRKMKRNILDNSNIKNSESLILNNNNTITSGLNNAISTNNFYNSNNHKFNNINFSKTNDVNYSIINYKIKVDEINIYGKNLSENYLNSYSSSNNKNQNFFNFNGNIISNAKEQSTNFKNRSKVDSITNIPNVNINHNINNNNNNLNNFTNPTITTINSNLNPQNNSNQNININININTNVNFKNFPPTIQDTLQSSLSNLNSFNYNICLNNNVTLQQNSIASPPLIAINNQPIDAGEGELIINITYNYISKIIKKKLSDFKRLIHEVSEVNKSNENIKLLNKLLKMEEIIVNNNLYSLCDSVIQNIFDNLNTIYKNEISINEFFHEFFDDSFSYSRGLSINSNYYDCSKKFIHFHRLYNDGKILSIKGEVKDIIIMAVEFKAKNFYLISLSFELSILISGFKQEECYLKYKYRELMEYICFMKNELGMRKMTWKNFKNEKTRKKDLKIAELDLQLKEILNNKDFLKKEKWLDIFNLNKCYRQMKDYNRVKSSFTSYPSFISISRDSFQNITD